MQSVFIELTKYIFAFLMAFYVLSAYRGAIIHREEKRKGIYFQQYIIIFLIHFLGYYQLHLLILQINYVIEKLSINHLLDDEKLKEDYLEYYSSLNYGENRIKDKLINGCQSC